MTEPETTVCRAKLEDDCYDGKPMPRSDPDDDPERMSEDGTWDGESIVCDACYIRLMPLTRSGQALTDEIPEAIYVYRSSKAQVRAWTPKQLADAIAGAEQAAASARPDSPMHMSATTMVEMGRREQKRREEDQAN